MLLRSGWVPGCSSCVANLVVAFLHVSKFPHCCFFLHCLFLVCSYSFMGCLSPTTVFSISFFLPCVLSPFVYSLWLSFLPFYWIIDWTWVQFPVLSNLSSALCIPSHMWSAVRKKICVLLKLARWQNKGNRTGWVVGVFLCRISKFYQISWTQSQHRVEQAESCRNVHVHLSFRLYLSFFFFHMDQSSFSERLEYSWSEMVGENKVLFSDPWYWRMYLLMKDQSRFTDQG